MHTSFSCMTIDENKEIFDLSDHNLLVATFNENTPGGRHFSKKRKQISYLKINDETISHGNQE